MLKQCARTSLSFTFRLVVHCLVDPLGDTGQPLLEAHRHCALFHGLHTP